MFIFSKPLSLTNLTVSGILVSGQLQSDDWYWPIFSPLILDDWSAEGLVARSGSYTVCPLVSVHGVGSRGEKMDQYQLLLMMMATDQDGWNCQVR